MTSFRTELRPERNATEIDHKRPVFFIGSCFSDNMGRKFADHRFHVVHNPFGVTYNPVSISEQLKRLAEQRPFEEEDLIQCNGGWNSFELHGSFQSASEKELLDKANKSLKDSSRRLAPASHLFLTMGTAWVYRHKEKDIIVNNCHKISAREFSREKLEVEDMVSALEKAIAEVRKINPSIHVVYTVSPVRHLKDGFEENSLSKAALRLAAARLAGMEKSSYFPSYELVMDDLRDYRFYKKDMLHPSDEAIDYIWDKLSSSMFSEECKKVLPKIEKLSRSLAHRPQNAGSSSHREFLEGCLSLARSIRDNEGITELDADIEKLRKILGN